MFYFRRLLSLVYRALLHVMQETLGNVNGNVERIAENRYVTRQIQKGASMARLYLYIEC